jgi:hypothetical protein
MVPNTGVSRALIAGLIVASHSRSPLKALLVPLVVAFDALLGTVSGDIGLCLLVAARATSMLPCSGRSMTTSWLVMPPEPTDPE